MSNTPKPEEPYWLTPEQRQRIDREEEEVTPVRRLLRYVWIRLVVVLVVLVLLAVGLALPPMWRSSPEGFSPVVRVSLLEQLQGRSLRRAAQRLQAEGKTEEALLAWRQAIANNPADLVAHRGFIQTLGTAARPAAQDLPLGLWRAQWLLRLSHTNQADLELVAHLCVRYEVNDLALALMLPTEAKLSEAGLGDLLRTLFRNGQMEQFQEVWSRHPGVDRNDPELTLFHTAWAIAW
ncbi:MAG TPA: hypothetical protein VMB21_08290, partial [Candidatus Limnocylindria bacterium]|nr:hypothetical protein [Candidatus Limnocylindria bacterium]